MSNYMDFNLEESPEEFDQGIRARLEKATALLTQANGFARSLQPALRLGVRFGFVGRNRNGKMVFDAGRVQDPDTSALAAKYIAELSYLLFDNPGDRVFLALQELLQRKELRNRRREDHGPRCMSQIVNEYDAALAAKRAEEESLYEILATEEARQGAVAWTTEMAQENETIDHHSGELCDFLQRAGKGDGEPGRAIGFPLTLWLSLARTVALPNYILPRIERVYWFMADEAFDLGCTWSRGGPLTPDPNRLWRALAMIYARGLKEYFKSNVESMDGAITKPEASELIRDFQKISVRQVDSDLLPAIWTHLGPSDLDLAAKALCAVQFKIDDRAGKVGLNEWSFMRTIAMALGISMAPDITQEFRNRALETATFVDREPAAKPARKKKTAAAKQEKRQNSSDKSRSRPLPDPSGIR